MAYTKILKLVFLISMMNAAFPAVASEDFTYEKRFEKNCQMKSVRFCQGGAQTLSERDNWLVILAFGGNEKLFNTAKRVVRRLNNEGIRAYLIHAPDRDDWTGSMHVDYYTNGGMQYGVSLDACRELPMRPMKSLESSSTLSLYPCSRPKAVNRSITSNFSGFLLTRFKIFPLGNTDPNSYF